MRAAITTTIALAALLVAGPAGAAGGSSKDPGKGASAPASAGAGPSSGGGGETAPTDSRTADRAQSPETVKTWEVGASVEYHHLLASQDTNNFKGLLYLGFYGRWDVTKYDRIAVRGGAYQQSVVDSGDSQVRFDDLSLAYTRRFPLLGGANLRLTGAFILPTGYASQRATMIVAPRLTIQADKRFGKYFTLDARVSGTGYIVRCATEGPYDCSVGGAADASGNGVMANPADPGGTMPNAKAVVGGTLSAELDMPFHEALSLGVSGYAGYIWFYQATGSVPADAGLPSYVQPSNAAYMQPVQQSWGGEVYLRYAFPSLVGIKTDLSIAFADGDPTKGYGSVLHDGVLHIASGFRQTLEGYAVIGARY